MAERAKPCDVQAILADTGVEFSEQSLRSAIAAATVMVDRCADEIGDAAAVQAEAYLAAHFVAAMNPELSTVSETTACGESARYGFSGGDGIMGSRYGQMANMLSNGCLVAQSKPQAGLFSIGSL